MDGVIWIIDTSSIAQVRRSIENSRKAHIFLSMTALVKAGRLLFPKQVVNELERGADPKNLDAQLNWAKENQPKATEIVPTLEEVKKVLAVAGNVLDPEKDSGVEEADPYVLAVAIRLREEKKDARIVTEENSDRPRKISLRTAAGMLGVASVPLKAFLELEKIA